MSGHRMAVTLVLATLFASVMLAQRAKERLDRLWVGNNSSGGFPDLRIIPAEWCPQPRHFEQLPWTIRDTRGRPREECEGDPPLSPVQIPV